MGCDFEILIQALHGSCWVTIVKFGTKTRCGGYPLCPAPRAILKAEQVRGNHGTTHQVLLDEKVAKDLVLYQSASEEPGHVKLRITSEEIDAGHEVSKQDGENEDDCELSDEEYEREKWQKEFIFYSLDEFSRMLDYIQPISSDPADLYNQILAPVPKWCEMARSAFPLTCGEIWMSNLQENQTKTTNALRAAQETLLEEYTILLISCIPALPPEVVKLVAPYAVPQATDVRVAWRDDEGQSADIRSALK